MLARYFRRDNIIVCLLSQDNNGYVEGLTHEMVDDYIRKFTNGSLDPLKTRTQEKEGAALERMVSAYQPPSTSVETANEIFRQSSILGKEDEIVQGAIGVWRLVQDKMGQVEESIRQGSIRSDIEKVRPNTAGSGGILGIDRPD